jgi:hypothetical protein
MQVIALGGLFEMSRTSKLGYSLPHEVTIYYQESLALLSYATVRY